MAEKRAHVSTEAETGASMAPMRKAPSKGRKASGRKEANRMERVIFCVPRRMSLQMAFVVEKGYAFDKSDLVRKAVDEFLEKALARIIFEENHLDPKTGKPLKKKPPELPAVGEIPPQARPPDEESEAKRA